MIWLIVILGLTLRLVSLNQSLWLDEAIQIWASRDFGLRALLFDYMRGDANPPLYHLLLHFWIKIFGDSEIAVRMVSVLFGILSILLLYLIINGLSGLTGLNKKKSTRQPVNSLIKNKLTPILLFATSPLHIYYSQEARMYSFACFAVLLMIWRFLVWQKNKRFKNSCFLATSLVFMGFSHYLCLLIVPVIWVATDRRHFKQLALIHLLLISFYLLYSPILFQQLKTGIEMKALFPVWGRTVGSFSFKAAALLPVKFIIGRISIYNKMVYGLIAGFLVFIFWGLALLGVGQNLKFRPLRESPFGHSRSVLVLLLFLPPLLGFAISFFVPVFSYFRFLFVLPFFYLLISLGVGKIKKENLRKLTIAFLLSVNLVCSLVYLFNSRFHREDWKGMVNWLHQQEAASVLIISQASKPFEYYDRGESNLLFWSKDKEKIEENDKIWLVEYALPIFDPQEVVKGELLERGFVLVKQKSFREIVLSFWQKEVYARP